MTKRLTPKWCDTLEEAFGENGAKGRRGEIMIKELYDNLGEYDTIDYHNDIQKQNDGIDLAIKKNDNKGNKPWSRFYTLQVKNDMDKYGNIWVELNTLESSKADRIVHLCEDTGWVGMYDRLEMLEHYRTENKFRGMSKVRIQLAERPKFIKRMKCEAKENFYKACA